MDLHSTIVPLSFVTRSNVEKRGWLNKWCHHGLRRSWKRRYCVLKGSHLFYFKSDKETEPVAGVISLDGYRATTYDVNCKKSRFCFKLLPTEVCRGTKSRLMSQSQRAKECQFFAENGDEMHAWIQAIQRWLPRSESNILDSVLDRLDYEKYIQDRCNYDLRSRSSRESIGSTRSPPSLSSGSSSGEETPVRYGTPTSMSPTFATADSRLSSPTATLHNSRSMTIVERRRMLRNSAARHTIPKPEGGLSRRRSTSQMLSAHRIPQVMCFAPFDQPEITDFKDHTPSVTTPTFGVSSSEPVSPDEFDFGMYLPSTHHGLQ